MNIAKIDYKSDRAPFQFSQSLRDTGFAVLQRHPVDPSLLNEVYDGWAKFFASPSKQDYLFRKEDQSGYFPFRTENAKDRSIKDLKEFYHIYTESKIPVGLESSTLSLKNQLIQIGGEILGWLQNETPEEIRKFFSIPLPQMIQGNHRSLFRILHYPPLGSDIEAGAVRAAAHEDINLLTLLPAATAPGLEVKDKNGKWHEVSCDPGNIVVNAGDMLQLASQGYYKSTTHQVVNPSDENALKSRYSLPLFLHPRPDVFLSEKQTAEMYLDERLREIGLK